MDREDQIPQGRVRRTMPLAGFTARAAGGRLVAGLRQKTGDQGAVRRFHERTAERYAELLGDSKGVLMKAGQLLSMVDISSVDGQDLSPYQVALSRLQADAPAMAPELARRIVEDDLGAPIREVFAEFCDEPMAAASIGQVHRAVLPDGRAVVVKVQYPGVAQAIRDDLANTELLATFLRFGTAAAGDRIRFEPTDIAREIAARIAEELDYRNEAANIAAFSRLYRGHPLIRIPEPVPEACGGRVLTMTHVDGMSWEQAQLADQELKDTWAEVIMRFATGSYRHANLFHADPHPGNYRFGADGSVGFVDFGCVKILDNALRIRLIRMLRAVVEGRRGDLHALMIETGFAVEGSAFSADDSYAWWAGLVGEVLQPQPSTFTPESTRRVFRESAAMLPRMSIPQDLVFFSRINLGMNAVLIGLHASGHFRSMLDDMDGAAEPVTEVGKKHCLWVRERGLPFGLEHDEF